MENRKIKIFVESIVITGTLNKTSTADLFWANLPMEHTISTRGVMKFILVHPLLQARKIP